MNAQKFKQLLRREGACKEAKDWAHGKSWQEAYETCHRGDWLIWLYSRSKSCDIQKMTLIYELCANTVLDLAVAPFFACNTWSAANAAACVAGNAAYAAARKAHATVDDAYAAAEHAKNENRKKTADIVREVLPIDIWNM